MTLPSPMLDLFAILDVAVERTEEVVLELIAPLAREISTHPDLDSLFYGCFAVPQPQVRFRVLGRRSWVDGLLRTEMERRIARLERSGLIGGHEFGHYRREVERYGGEEGMRLTERIYHHDSIACLRLIEADAAKRLRRSRREISVVMTERILDLLKIHGASRLAFYRFAGRFPSPDADWQDEDAAAFDARYEQLREGLDLLSSEGSAGPRDPAVIWGGEAAMRIAEECLAALRVPVETVRVAHDAGRIAQDLNSLAWSWTHLHCNRLGIAAVPEAILRQLMYRHYLRRAEPKPRDATAGN